MTRTQVLCCWTMLGVMIGCGAQTNIRHTRLVIAEDIVNTSNWRDSLRLGTQTSNATVNCIAQEAASFYDRHARIPGDYQRLRANGCCGPTSRLKSIQCASGTTKKLNTWLDKLPPERRTGAIGVGHVAHGKQRTLCLIRLNSTKVRLDKTDTNGSQIVIQDNSRPLFARLQTSNSETEEVPAQHLSGHDLIIDLPRNTLAVELLHLNQPLNPPLAAFLMPSAEHCGVLEPKTDSSLDMHSVLDAIHKERAQVSQTPLRLSNQWQAPLTSWLERMGDLPTQQDIVGLLDARGWILPRVRIIRLNMVTPHDLKGLIRNSPSLRSLISDPYMTSISIRRFNNKSGYVFAFIQEPTRSTPQAFENAFLSLLNASRRQVNLPRVQRIKTPLSVPKSTDCDSAIKALREDIHDSNDVRIWMKVELSDLPDRSTPSCTMHYTAHKSTTE